MNNLPRQKLCEIIAQYGRSLCDNPQRCEGLLRDFCGQYRKEISALVGAVREGIPGELISSQNSAPPVVLLARLAKKLHENLALDENAAKWAVESWALALGVIFSNDIQDNSSPAPPPPPTSSFSVSPTIPVQPPVTVPSQPAPPPVTAHSQPTPPSPSNHWQKLAIAGGTIGILALLGGLLHFQGQQRQGIEQEIAELKVREEQRLEQEQRQREDAERQREEAERQREATARQLAEEQRQRETAERQLEAERQRQETFVPSKSINESISEGEAISLIENLYSLLSAKRFEEASSLYSPQLTNSFSPSFFSKFERVSVEDLQVTSTTGNSINFRGQNTYVWTDGSTQREIRSYTVRNLDGQLKLTASEFIKVTKFR